MIPQDATEEEFKLAEEAIKFAHAMLAWWEKDKPLNLDDNFDSRTWDGLVNIAKWGG